MNTKPLQIIAAFPGTGKSYYASRTSGVADSDSSTFSRGPEWPANYIAHIRELLAEGATVLVSTHVEVRQALEEAGLFFTLVYPEFNCRIEYVDRMRRRGSPAALVEVVITNWNRWLTDCRDQRGCDHIILGPGEYLTDVIPDIELRDVA